MDQLTQFLKWTKKHLTKAVLVGIIVGIPILLVYNLDINPRPWHDEASALLVARTLVEDGIYAMRNSDGYQTFGPVQSIGPTVILPVALSFRLFGVGIFQGRIVGVFYTLCALLFFFLVGKYLYDTWTGILGLFFLLAAPAVRIFIYGREVLGEVPALAFFLAGVLSLAGMIKKNNPKYSLSTGLLFGAAMITKSQYVIILTSTLSLLIILDVWYYRQSAWRSLATILVISISCLLLWEIWQVGYYGLDEFQTNINKLSLLGASTIGLHKQTILSGIRSILGTDSGHYFLFWGFPALGYVYYHAIERTRNGLLNAFLSIFPTIWLIYFVFWIVPWHHYALPAMALTALFVGRVFMEILRSVLPYLSDLQKRPEPNTTFSSQKLVVLGAIIALFSCFSWAGYNLQTYIRSDVIDKNGLSGSDFRSPPQFQNPWIVAEYLKQNVPENSIIETWERELGIITDLTYHFPDLAILAKTHNSIYRGAPVDYLLGQEYFTKVQAEYVVIGWFERSFPIYDKTYLEKNFELIYRVGEGNYNYEVYKIIKSPTS